ncbi:MAG: hypothetical protein AAGA86_10125 [Bacteroidota bacterium]
MERTVPIKINALGLSGIVDTIVVSEEIGSEKPDERNFKVIEHTFPNYNYVYIADNLRKDFISPNQLGWNSIGLIDNGLNMHFDGHRYFHKKTAPNAFVTCFGEINVV